MPQSDLRAAEATAAAANEAKVSLEPVNRTQFFLRPNHAETLTWRSAGAGQSFTCEVRDYRDQLVSSHPVAVQNGELKLPVQLPAGFYTVTVQPGGQQFGVMAIEPHSGQADQFFAIDAALSWLETRPEMRTDLVALLKRGGIGLVRERLSWGAVNPEPEKWDWEANRQFDTLRREYRRQGVQLLDLFHSAPGWAGVSASNPYPQKLTGVKQSWQKMAERWQGSWNALEVWNEPDIATGGELPADQYLPVVKTVSYAFQENKARAAVGGGVFGYFNPSFIQNAVKNGLLDQVDFVSFHTYAKAPSMEQIIGDYRKALTPKGHAPVPLWLTEAGQPWNNGPGRPPVGEDAASALDISMKAVEAKACGIVHYFAFVYPYYAEGERNFGMMGQEVTPLRSMAAYVQAVAELSGATYIGDLSLKNAPVQRARVFAKGEQAIIVLYAENAAAGATVPWSGPVQSIRGIDGRVLNRPQNGAIPLPDGLTYVHTTVKALGGALQRQTAASQLAALGKNARSARPPGSAIVLQPLLPAATLPTKRGYKVTENAMAAFPFRVRVNNLANEPRKVKLVGTINGSARLAERPVELAPLAWAEVQWDVDLNQASQQSAAEAVTLEVAGAEQGAAAISPLAVELFCERDLDTYLRLYPASAKVELTDLTRWKPSITGTGQMKMNIDDAQNWQLKTTFKGGDRWVFPEFRLPQNVNFTHSEGLILRARALAPSVVRVMVKERSGATYFTPFSAVTPDGQWHSVVLHWQDLAALPSAPPDANGQLDLDQVESISLGMNSRADDNTLEVSGLYVARKNSSAASRP